MTNDWIQQFCHVEHNQFSLFESNFNWLLHLIWRLKFRYHHYNRCRISITESNPSSPIVELNWKYFPYLCGFKVIPEFLFLNSWHFWIQVHEFHFIVHDFNKTQQKTLLHYSTTENSTTLLFSSQFQLNRDSISKCTFTNRYRMFIHLHPSDMDSNELKIYSF